MEVTSNPGKIKTVRPETLAFIILYNQLKGRAFTGNAQLAEVLGFNSASSITEIIKSRQNIDPEKFKLFKEHYRQFIDEPEYKPYDTTEIVSKVGEGIPMYEIPATASGVEVYNDINDIVTRASYTIIADGIQKEEYIKKYGKLSNVYELCLSFIIERAVFYLDDIPINQCMSP